MITWCVFFPLSQIILNSMQQYQPCLRITSQRCGTSKSYTFAETKFIAVTAYQNNKVSISDLDVNSTVHHLYDLHVIFTTAIQYMHQ